MIESRFSTDRRVLFREVFTPDSIAKNGGVITGGVTLSNGVATMDGTGYITYSGNKDLANKSQFTIRTKARREATNKLVYVSFLTDANNRVEFLLYTDGKVYGINCNGVNNSHGSVVDPYNDSDLHDMVFVFDGTGVTDADKVKVYIDNISLTLTFGAAIPTNTITSGTFYVGKGVAGNAEGSFELVEIYDGCLSPEEISLLHGNRLYSGFIQQNCILHADYTRKTSLNWKDTDGIHTDTDILYKHGLGAEFNGSTSVINYGSPNIFDFGTEDLTVEMVYCPTVSSFKPILSKYSANTGFAWYINSGKQRLYFGDGTSVNTNSNTAGTIGLSHHYCVAMDRSGLATFYLDGNADGTLDISGKSGSINTIVDMLTGYGAAVISSGFIKYIRIYKGKALSAENVAQNHQYAVDNYGCE